MPPPPRPLALAALAVLAGCGLVGGDEPLAPGTFELTVTGDVEATAAGGPVYVAAPDSGLNVATGEWTVDLPIVFESDLDAGDGAEVVLALGEPTEPNGPFTEVPEGTFVVGYSGPTTVSVFLGVRTPQRSFTAAGGRLQLRRTAGGIEGEAESPFVSPSITGEAKRGRVRLRFHALAERPPDPDEL